MKQKKGVRNHFDRHKMKNAAGNQCTNKENEPLENRHVDRLVVQTSITKIHTHCPRKIVV